MMKKTILISALALAGAVAVSAPATAKVNLNIGSGVPLYGGDCWHEDCYGGGYGYITPVPSFRISCSEGRSIVRDHGYRKVSARDCSGSTFKFIGWKFGDPWLIRLNSRSGSITGRSPL